MPTSAALSLRSLRDPGTIGRWGREGREVHSPGGAPLIIKVELHCNEITSTEGRAADSGRYPVYSNFSAEERERIVIADEWSMLVWSLPLNSPAVTALVHLTARSPTKWFAQFCAEYRDNGGLDIYMPALPPQPW